MTIFGTTVQAESFPSTEDKPPVRLWIYGKSSGSTALTDNLIAALATRAAEGGGEAPVALLTRAQVQDAIETLQRILDEAGPEPIPEPECDYLVDDYGDFWVKPDENGWANGPSLDAARGSANRMHFASVVAARGPLQAFKIEEQITEVHVPTQTIA